MPSIQHPILGHLEYTDDSTFGRTFKGAFKSASAEVILTIDLDDGEQGDVLEMAAMLVRNWDALTARAIAEAVKDKRSLYNDTWRQEEDPELSAEEFAARLVVDRLNVLGPTGCSCWFTDKDLFWGHSIHVDFADLDANAASISSAKAYSGLFG